MQAYQNRPWLDLVDCWVVFNHHLAHAVRQIPADALETPCRIGANEPVTLGFLVEDYRVHLEHHLKQIEERAAA